MLGPFHVTGERSLEILGDAGLGACEVRQMQIVGTGSLLVTVAHKLKKIHVWDAFGPLSTGTCLHVIRRETADLRSLCCSKSLLFTISQEQKSCYQPDYNHLLEISVWALPSTTNAIDSDCPPRKYSPMLAILKNPPNMAPISHAVRPLATYYEQQLALLPESSLLVSSHGDGTVNIWKYDDSAAQEDATGQVAVHLRTFQISRGHQLDVRSLLTSPTLPAMVYMTDTLFCHSPSLPSICRLSLPHPAMLMRRCLCAIDVIGGARRDG